MSPAKALRRRAGIASIAVTAIAWAIAPGAALGATSTRGAGVLSPRLAELAQPGVRSLSVAKQARVLSLASHGPGSLLREGSRLVVDVRFDHGAVAAIGELEAAGAEVVNASRRYQTVTVAVLPADLRKLATVTGVEAVTEDLAPLVFAGAGCPSGATVSEGDAQLRAAEARSEFGVDGGGVTVGILSDSFDRNGTAVTHAAEDVATGDLPGASNPCGHTSPVNVLGGDPESEGADEGRAMTQIVHDLAPGARLAFATAFSGEPAFAENIERLAKPVSASGAGARVIADDVVYFDEPFFQDGPVATAVENVIASGAAYFSAAGNDNLIDEAGLDVASWEAPEFRDSLGCPAALTITAGPGTTHCMDFDPEGGVGHTDETFGITVEAGATLSVDLQWAEPWFGVEDDLDAFLLDSTGEPIEEEGSLVSSTMNNIGTQEPFEFLQWENTGPEQEVQLAINRCAGAPCNPGASSTNAPRLKIALLENGGGVSETEYPESSGGDTTGPTIFGHSGSAGAVSVGAVPFFSNSEPEEYSSRGPVTHYFGPVVDTSAAEELESPQVIEKPDLVATDCGVTTFFAFQDEAGDWRFCGTSAAAPHAAAVAALMLQRNPSLSPAQVRTALADTAQPVGSFGPDAIGAGLVDAFEAVHSVAPSAGGGPPEEGGSGSAGGQIAALPPPPPRTFFRKHPPKAIRTRGSKAVAVFRFGADEAGVTFLCRVDKGPFRACPARFVRRYRLGSHVVSVMARDAQGNVDPTPVVFRFRVKRVG
jgi:subtilisin family serine protease